MNDAYGCTIAFSARPAAKTRCAADATAGATAASTAGRTAGFAEDLAEQLAKPRTAQRGAQLAAVLATQRNDWQRNLTNERETQIPKEERLPASQTDFPRLETRPPRPPP